MVRGMILYDATIAMDSRYYVVVESFSHVRVFATPWTAACKASLFFTISWSLFKLMPIETEMPSNDLILYQPLLLLPSPESFLMSRLFASGSQTIGAAVSISVLPMYFQG